MKKSIICLSLLLSMLCLLPGAANAEDARTLDDLKGKRIGVLKGSVFEEITRQCVENPIVIYYNSTSDQSRALADGAIDGFAADLPVARALSREVGGLTYLADMLTKESYAFAFAQTSEGETLRDQFNEFLAKIKADGTLSRLDEIWSGDDESAKTIIDTKELTGENGSIRYAADCTLPPFCYARDGEIIGYEIDIITRFCREHGYGLEYKVMDFADVIPSLVAGESDMAGACIVVTKKRAMSVHFSDDTYTGGVVMMTRR